jgi:hypothetical protein
MAHRKAKAAHEAAAPRPRRRHVKKTGWLLKMAAQAFSSIVAPLLVGLALQCVRGHDLPQTSLISPHLDGVTTSATSSSPHGPTSQETTSYKALFAGQALPTSDRQQTVPSDRRDQAADDDLGTE